MEISPLFPISSEIEVGVKCVVYVQWCVCVYVNELQRACACECVKSHLVQALVTASEYVNGDLSEFENDTQCTHTE